MPSYQEGKALSRQAHDTNQSDYFTLFTANDPHPYSMKLAPALYGQALSETLYFSLGTALMGGW